ncbi:ribosome small subunit-dependent GTPase A [Dolosicoccus paucivorans]|uniref:ribosome small subunit-dependent GTPase A n=1 Tax=Dolosicoccus paucivorans TaxID=84521 RepID=UPI00088302F6|nr:ribosome small subunit-dependent GTPase A [Dolosicoccus paucivorans]PMB84483.1 ribosome small subunit-dependent GTPase A [Dolosicoccus paucivorans]SDI29322.1 ribosome biogenesis GTPase [Dolosicoccus paucivorans]
MTDQTVQLTGTIFQSVAGFYYVWADGTSYATKPRGNFRHLNIKPLVGDRVVFELDTLDEQSEGRIIEVLDRTSELKRPAVANVDYAFVVMALTQPAFSYNLLDYFLVSMEAQGIQPMIILTKYDLLIEEKGEEKANELVEEIKRVYHQANYTVKVFNYQKESHDQLEALIEKEAIYTVVGQTGVGKSTLLNALIPDVNIQTAAISESLNRGRHTTREVTLYRIGHGFVADTPGFSSMDLSRIEKEQLQQYFPEIWQEGAYCRFNSCQHINEPGCHVKQAVEEETIATSRYNNYLDMYEKISQAKPVYNRKK